MNLENNNKPIISEDKTIKKMKKTIVILSSLLGILAASLTFIIYYNYDYLAFKLMLTNGYIYQDSLSTLVNDELEQEDSNTSAYFDDAVINVFLDKLYDISGDKYTYLYLPYQYTNRITNEKELGQSCEWIPFNENTAYVRIANFSDESTEFMESNESDISKYENIIIDLRGNGGGYLKSVNKIADMFLEKGTVISTEKTLISALSRENKAEDDPIFNFSKIIILQDGQTASASEIMIGALKDNLDNVTLLGETSFGKGIGQTTIPLKKGFYLKATAFSWSTPNGNEIQGKGIAPDYPLTVEKLNEVLEN